MSEIPATYNGQETRNFGIECPNCKAPFKYLEIEWTNVQIYAEYYQAKCTLCDHEWGDRITRGLID